MPQASALCSSLAARLAGHHLPVIRQTAVQVISLLSNPQSNVQKIADVVLRDQAFTARVLKVANSAYYQRRGDKITTISRAILTIGYTTLRDIALAAEFAEFAQKQLPTSVNLRRLLAKAFVAAQQATALGEAVRISEPEALFTSALLESLGEFALASALPAVAQQIDEAVQCQGLPYEDAHLQVAGMTPHEVTILVAQTYQFPEDLLLPLPAWESCSQWTDTDRRCGVVHFANACAANLFAPDSSLVLIQFANLMAQATQALGVPLTRIDSLLTESYLKAMELGASVDLDRTCFVLDGSTPDDKGRQSLLRTCAQLAAPA